MAPSTTGGICKEDEDMFFICEKDVFLSTGYFNGQVGEVARLIKMGSSKEKGFFKQLRDFQPHIKKKENMVCFYTEDVDVCIDKKI